jgi:hypothetical protein
MIIILKNSTVTFEFFLQTRYMPLNTFKEKQLSEVRRNKLFIELKKSKKIKENQMTAVH